MVPDAPDGEVSIGAAGGGAAAGVVDVGHQGVGRGADHGLQVDAGVGEGRDGQRPLTTQPGGEPGAGEPGHCGGGGTHTHAQLLLHHPGGSGPRKAVPV